nr:hypothetical protein Q903MT_gene2064 [Picea sitchensis]
MIYCAVSTHQRSISNCILLEYRVGFFLASHSLPHAYDLPNEGVSSHRMKLMNEPESKLLVFSFSFLFLFFRS